MVIEYFMF